MALPETDVARLRRWAEDKVPAHVRDELWMELDVDERAVTIQECRPPWDGVGGPTRFPVARLRYVMSRREWELFWRDRDERFARYPIAPTPDVAALLAEIDADPTALFWG